VNAVNKAAGKAIYTPVLRAIQRSLRG